MNDDRDGVAPIQSYGVEAQLNLNSGRGITPFLVAGVGRVDFMDGFQDVDGDHPEDKDAAILGGGARLDLGRVGLMAAARSYLFQAGDSIDDDLRNNLQLTAGLTFRLGSPGRPRAAAARPTVIRETPDTVYVAQEGTVERRTERREGDDPQQFVTIPIPREGEIYLRYGPADSSTVNRRPDVSAGAVTAGQMEALRRQVLADLEPMLRELMAAERSGAARDGARRAAAHGRGGAYARGGAAAAGEPGGARGASGAGARGPYGRRGASVASRLLPAAAGVARVHGRQRGPAAAVRAGRAAGPGAAGPAQPVCCG